MRLRSQGEVSSGLVVSCRSFCDSPEKRLLFLCRSYAEFDVVETTAMIDVIAQPYLLQATVSANHPDYPDGLGFEAED